LGDPVERREIALERDRLDERRQILRVLVQLTDRLAHVGKLPDALLEGGAIGPELLLDRGNVVGREPVRSMIVGT
jgi:hypothetical protein